MTGKRLSRRYALALATGAKVHPHIPIAAQLTASRTLLLAAMLSSRLGTLTTPQRIVISTTCGTGVSGATLPTTPSITP